MANIFKKNIFKTRVKLRKRRAILAIENSFVMAMALAIGFIIWKSTNETFYKALNSSDDNSDPENNDRSGKHQEDPSRSDNQHYPLPIAPLIIDDRSKDYQAESREPPINQPQKPKPSILEDPVMKSTDEHSDPENNDRSGKHQEDPSRSDNQHYPLPIAPLSSLTPTNKLKGEGRIKSAPYTNSSDFENHESFKNDTKELLEKNSNNKAVQQHDWYSYFWSEYKGYLFTEPNIKSTVIPIVPWTAIYDRMGQDDYFTPWINEAESAFNSNQYIKQFFFQEQLTRTQKIFTNRGINQPIQILEHNADFKKFVLAKFPLGQDHPDLTFINNFKKIIDGNLDVKKLSETPEIKLPIYKADIPKFQSKRPEVGCSLPPMAALGINILFHKQVSLKPHPDKVPGREESFKFAMDLEAFIATKGKWNLQQIIYSHEITRVQQIFITHGIHQPIDILNNDAAFKNFILDKFYLDKENNNQDFIFIRDFQQQMSADLDIARPLAHVIQTVIHRTSEISQSLDTIVDAVRLCREPTIDHAKKLCTDLVYLYSVYSGFNGCFYLVNGLDAMSHAYNREYQQALIQVGTTIILPTAIVYVIPSTTLIISPVIGIYTLYSTAVNMHQLYLEYGNAEVEAKSIAARQVFIEGISDPIALLQNIFSHIPVIKEERGYKFNYNQSWSEFLYEEASLHSNIDQIGFIFGSILFYRTYASPEFQLIHYQATLIRDVLIGVSIAECVYGIYSFNSWSSKLHSWWNAEQSTMSEEQLISEDPHCLGITSHCELNSDF